MQSSGLNNKAFTDIVTAVRRGSAIPLPYRFDIHDRDSITKAIAKCHKARSLDIFEEIIALYRRAFMTAHMTKKKVDPVVRASVKMAMRYVRKYIDSTGTVPSSDALYGRGKAKNIQLCAKAINYIILSRDLSVFDSLFAHQEEQTAVDASDEMSSLDYIASLGVDKRSSFKDLLGRKDYNNEQLYCILQSAAQELPCYPKSVGDAAKAQRLLKKIEDFKNQTGGLPLKSDSFKWLALNGYAKNILDLLDMTAPVDVDNLKNFTKKNALTNASEDHGNTDKSSEIVYDFIKKAGRIPSITETTLIQYMNDLLERDPFTLLSILTKLGRGRETTRNLDALRADVRSSISQDLVLRILDRYGSLTKFGNVYTRISEDSDSIDLLKFAVSQVLPHTAPQKHPTTVDVHDSMTFVFNGGIPLKRYSDDYDSASENMYYTKRLADASEDPAMAIKILKQAAKAQKNRTDTGIDLSSESGKAALAYALQGYEKQARYSTRFPLDKIFTKFTRGDIWQAHHETPATPLRVPDEPAVRRQTFYEYCTERGILAITDDVWTDWLENASYDSLHTAQQRPEHATEEEDCFGFLVQCTQYKPMLDILLKYYKDEESNDRVNDEFKNIKKVMLKSSNIKDVYKAFRDVKNKMDVYTLCRCSKFVNMYVAAFGLSIKEFLSELAKLMR